MPRWPSRIGVSNRQIRIWAEFEQEEVEDIACVEMGVDLPSCAAFQWWYPAYAATNNVFEESVTEWRMRRPASTGFGDPQCDNSMV